MNTVRSILVVLYFLTMVLLPYGHMPLHASDHAEIAEGHHGCQHNHHEPDSESDSGDDCSLCNLTILLTDVPAVFHFSDFCFVLHSQTEQNSTHSDPALHLEHKARAPPFLTV